jgi:hypothetical protein
VDRTLFLQVHELIAERSRRLSDEELLAWLKRAYEERGRLSALIIDEYDAGPSSSAFRSRFGSLVRAYRLVGYVPDHDYAYLEINRRLRRLHPEVVEQIVSAMRAQGATVSRDQRTDLLTVNDEFTLSVAAARCRQLVSGVYRWVIRLDAALRPDVTVAVRMDWENSLPMDYYFLPALDISGEKLRLAEANGLFFDAYRFDSLDYLVAMARRIHVKEMA